ncbi:RDD family protein, partial [Acinetobacter guillouiae]|uniref:RDD family protein n=1 Tax=Acinetobacter guillouiae TaxID=106649 RepID=UPI003AF8595F
MDEAKPVWAGFWRRIGAYLIDTIILGAVGFAASMPFYDALAALTGPTRLIGLGVGAVYFGLTTSNLGGGASLGMRA